MRTLGWLAFWFCFPALALLAVAVILKDPWKVFAWVSLFIGMSAFAGIMEHRRQMRATWNLSRQRQAEDAARRAAGELPALAPASAPAPAEPMFPPVSTRVSNFAYSYGLPPETLGPPRRKRQKRLPAPPKRLPPP